MAAALRHFHTHGVAQTKIDRYRSDVEADHDLSLSARRRLANAHGGSEVPFSWDTPRTREGFYHYRAGLPAATKRAIHYGPYADLLWLETASPSVAKAAAFAGEIRDTHPGKPLVYNLSPSFNWMGHGFTESTLRSFIWDLAQHG